MFLKLAWRSLRRNPIRTWLTGTMISVGTAILIIGISWIFGVQTSVLNTMIQSNGQVRITTVAFEQKEERLPIIEYISETETLMLSLKDIPEIQELYTRLGQRVLWQKEGAEVLEENIALFSGTSPDYYQNQMRIEDSLLFGRNLEGKGEALVGAKIAEKNGLQTNDELLLFGRTQDGSISPLKLKIIGIGDFGNPVHNNAILGVLEDAQWMADIPNGGTEILIYGDGSGDNIAENIRILHPDLAQETNTFNRDGKAIAFSVRSWNQREPLRSLLPILLFFDGFMILSIVLVTALGILNTMIMSILERQKELSVLRAIGCSKWQIARILFLETLLLSIIGGGVGCLIGSIISIQMEAYGVPLGDALSESSQLIASQLIHPDWRIEIALFGFVLSLIMGVLGTVFPLIHLFRLPIVNSTKY